MRRVETHFPRLKEAGARDMVDALALRARERPGAPALLTLARGEQETPSVSYANLWDRARQYAAAIAMRTSAGARVVLAFPAGAEFVAALFGCWIAGRIAVPVPVPRGASVRLAGVVRDCAAALLVTDAERGAPLAVLTPNDLEEDRLDPIRRDAEDIALLQYTSGSTGDPKGVALPHRAIWHNQSVIRTCFDHEEGVVLVGWLPNFHDMGLIGNLLQPIYCGGLSVIMAPLDFTQKPLRWLRAVSRYRAHTSGAPNFAYDLCVRAAENADLTGLDLSCWRVAFNGAEPVRARTIAAFADRFAPYGFRRTAMMACYGLAESTLMVTGAPVDEAPRIYCASAEAIAAGQLAPGGDRDFVACGDAVAGADVAIFDTKGRAPEGCVGEVLIRGPSLCAGYWGRGADDGAIWREGLRWRRTGDLGAWCEGRLYIVGRCKDLMILNGRNVHPADIESALETALAARGVLRALVVGAARATAEEVLVFLELSRSALRSDPAPLIAETRRAAASLEALPAAIVLLKPGAMPLTSSGKLRRSACRDLYMAGALPGVARTEPTRAGLAGDANTR